MASPLYKVGDIFYTQGKNWCIYIPDFWQAIDISASGKTITFSHIAYATGAERIKGTSDNHLIFREVTPLPNHYTKSAGAFQRMDSSFSDTPLMVIKQRIKPNSDENTIYSSQKYDFCAAYYDVVYHRFTASTTVEQCDEYGLMR